MAAKESSRQSVMVIPLSKWLRKKVADVIPAEWKEFLGLDSGAHSHVVVRLDYVHRYMIVMPVVPLVEGIQDEVVQQSTIEGLSEPREVREIDLGEPEVIYDDGKTRIIMGEPSE